MESVSQERPNLDRLKVFWPSLLWLLMVVVVIAGVLSYVGFARHGLAGAVAALVAGLICFLPSVVALLVTSFTTGTSNAVSGMFLGIFLRTVVPFGVSIFLVQAVAPLAESGLFGMVLVTYLVVLSVETCLAVRIVQTVHSASAVS